MIEPIRLDTTRAKVLQCIVDLFNERRGASRQLVAQLLNEKLSVVDDAVKRLKEDGLVRAVINGVFEPVTQHPMDRSISRTTLPDGRTKIEVADGGDLELSPHEVQVLGKMLHGDAMSLAYWHEERQQGALVVQLQAELRRLHHTVNQLRQRMPTRRGQRDLFVEEAPRRRQQEKETT